MKVEVTGKALALPYYEIICKNGIFYAVGRSDALKIIKDNRQKDEKIELEDLDEFIADYNRLKAEIQGRKTDEEIWRIFKNHVTPEKRDIDTRPEPQFFLKNLEGRTLIEERKIKNPMPYNPKLGPNPEHFPVLMWDDGSILLIERYSRSDEEARINAYLFDGKKVLFTSEMMP